MTLPRANIPWKALEQKYQIHTVFPISVDNFVFQLGLWKARKDIVKSLQSLTRCQALCWVFFHHPIKKWSKFWNDIFDVLLNGVVLKRIRKRVSSPYPNFSLKDISNGKHFGLKWIVWPFRLRKAAHWKSEKTSLSYIFNDSVERIGHWMTEIDQGIFDGGSISHVFECMTVYELNDKVHSHILLKKVVMNNTVLVQIVKCLDNDKLRWGIQNWHSNPKCTSRIDWAYHNSSSTVVNSGPTTLSHLEKFSENMYNLIWK